MHHGVAALTIHNRTAARAEALAARLRAAYPNRAVASGGLDPAGSDIVINATSLGLKSGDALPVDAALLTPAMLAAEVAVDPEITPFLAAAARIGCATHGGLPMLMEQIPILAEFVSGEG